MPLDDDEDDGLGIKSELEWKYGRKTPPSRTAESFWKAIRKFPPYMEVETVRPLPPKATTGVKTPVKWDEKKFGKTAQRYWQRTLTDVAFKMVDGAPVCVNCAEGEFDCRCDPNPFVERAMKADALLRKYGMTRNGHSIFAASGADGWMACYAFALVNAALPDKTSEYAAYGTIAHKIASNFLEWVFEQPDPRAANWIGEFEEQWVPELLGTEETADGFTFTCDKIMLHAVVGHVTKCMEDSIGADEIIIERRVDYSRYMPIPRQGGTLDFAALRSGHCTVDDAKFGEGVKVFAKGNKQILSYCVAVIEGWDWLYDFKTFTIRVNQPRLDHYDVWECTREDVLAHAEKMREWSHLGWKEGNARTPGAKQCRWCADKLCAARSAVLADTMASGFMDEPPAYEEKALEDHDRDLKIEMAAGEAPAPVDVRALSTEALAWRKKMRPVVDKFYEALEEELLRRSVGNKVPFFKRVAGRGSNEWIDEELAAVTLGYHGVPPDAIHETKIISVKKGRDQLHARGLKPKQIDKLLYGGDDPVARYVPGKPVLADEDDTRVELSGIVASGFDGDDDGLGEEGAM